MKLAVTIVPVRPDHLTSPSLVRYSTDRPVRCYVVTLPETAGDMEVVYDPAARRTGIAWDEDVQWITGPDVEDAIQIALGPIDDPEEDMP